MATRPHSEKGNDSRFNYNSSSDFHEKQGDAKRDSGCTSDDAKGNTWYFGYKAHIGVDKDSGLTHTVKATPANIHDVTDDV